MVGHVPTVRGEPQRRDSRPADGSGNRCAARPARDHRADADPASHGRPTGARGTGALPSRADPWFEVRGVAWRRPTYNFVGNADAIIDEIQEFLTGMRRGTAEADRVLATVLFVDMVGSTERATAVGDARWRDLLTTYHAQIGKEVARFRGRVIDTAGDGTLAIFDGPARAIRCADAVKGVLASQGLTVRAGLHTGECEVSGDKVVGITVHIASRVSALAGPGEILVSNTVKDLVAGSGLHFSDRGSHALKGVPGKWRLFAAHS